MTALKRRPLAAPENLQMSLTLFWLGQFEDAARYMRRAVADDAAVLSRGALLSARFPAGASAPRLDQLARLAPESADYCFYTGALLVLNRDYRRAGPFLIRAEELAGTDSQAAELLGIIDITSNVDRNLQKGIRDMKAANFADAARAFACSAMDRPRQGLSYAGLALGLAGEADDKMAMRFAATAEELCKPVSLFQWLVDCTPVSAPLALAAMRFEAPVDGLPKASLNRARFAAWLWFAAGYYASAERVAIAMLVEERQSAFALALLDYMASHDLSEDPILATPAPEPAKPEVRPDKPPAPPGVPQASAVEDSRKLIRKLDFAGALRILEPLITEDQSDPSVFQLMFVVLVGRLEISDGATALQAWFLRVQDAERMKLRVLRDCFDRDADYVNWKQPLIAARTTDLIAALPRLLLAACDISEGHYEQARTNVAVALRAEQKNTTLLEMSRLLALSKYQQDADVPKAPEVKEPRALLGDGEKLFREKNYEAARSKYLAAAEADPTLKDVQLCLLKVNFALGDYERAATQLEELFVIQNVEAQGADSFLLPLAGAYGETAEFTKHLASLVAACSARPLSDKPWLLLGAIQFGRRNYSDASDALQRYADNTTATPNTAAIKLLESSKKLAK